MRRILVRESQGVVLASDHLHPAGIAPVPVLVECPPGFLSPPSNCVPGSGVEIHLEDCRLSPTNREYRYVLRYVCALGRRVQGTKHSH
jgi:hypothetical protein